MPFIGIIAKENDGNFIKNGISKNSKKNRFDFIFINKKNIENIKNVKIEVLIINENINEFLKDSYYLERIINNSEYIIINSDVKNDLQVLNNYCTNSITYGLNAKCDITISSIKEEKILICIQNSINGIGKNNIEEQEIKIEVGKNNINKVYNVLAIFTMLIIYGEFLQKI